MFNPSRAEVRRFFFDAWRKYRASAPLEGLERTAVDIMLQHPEYHALMDQPDAGAEREYPPEGGVVNPFLHMSLHLAVAEQLSIDQPRGIATAYRELAARKGSEHDALHAVVECLGETVWRAQRDRAAPDEAAYLECIQRAAG
jgi:hypothetical protein